MKLILRILLYVLVALLLTYCGEKSDGAEIVDNPYNTDVKEIQLTLLRSVPLQLEEDNFRSWILADDKMYLCNTMQHKITILDLYGNIVKVLDSAGEGPGEFSLPGTIFHDKRNSRIEVFDVGNRRYSYFTYSGYFIEATPPDVEIATLTFNRCNFGEFVVEYCTEMYPQNGKMNQIFRLQIIKPDTTLVLYEVEGEDFRKIQHEFPEFSCDDRYVYVAPFSTDKYTIEVFDTNGKKVKIVHKKYTKRKISHEEIARTKERLKGQKGYDIPRYHTAIEDILTDEKGHLWVGTYDKKGNLYYDILNQKGKIIGRYRPPTHTDLQIYSLMRLYQNKLIEATINPDEPFIKMNIYKVDINE